MKSLALAFALFASSLAHASTDCEKLPANQQAVWKAFNAYMASGAESDALLYVGALSQYQTDVEALADHNDPDFGNKWSVDLSESNSANLCANGQYDKFEKRVLSGNRVAIELVWMYSAVYTVDGAGAEDLSQLQDSVRKKYPRVIDEILQSHAAFFKAHPVPRLELR